MERFAWKGYVLPGRLEEYKRRHNEIWPELLEVFREAGIRNYSIWNIRNELFGYYECADLQRALRVQAESPVTARWRESMKDVVFMDADPVTGVRNLPEQVFLYGDPYGEKDVSGLQT